jgi:hypothetical protein
LSSILHFPFHASDSDSTGVKPPKMFPSVSKITVRVFVWASQRQRKSGASKPSRQPRYRSENRFARNSAKMPGKPRTITEPSTGAAVGVVGACFCAVVHENRICTMSVSTRESRTNAAVRASSRNSSSSRDYRES